MSIAKIATLSLVSALSLLSTGSAQSAPLASLSVAAELGIERTDALQVRGRRIWHDGQIGDGQLNVAPYAYGGTYLGYTYGGFVRPPGYSCQISCWGPYRWFRRDYPIWRWWRLRRLPY